MFGKYVQAFDVFSIIPIGKHVYTYPGHFSQPTGQNF
jgi:hypothetical protein